jgi:hypothetical protein
MHIYLCEYVILAVNNLNIFRAWLALKIPSRRWLGKANVGGSRRLVGKRNADLKCRPTGRHRSSMHGHVSAHGRLVGKSKSHLPVCWEKTSLGKEISVGKEKVGRQRSASGVKLSVGKYMSVGKGLCRPDLR